MKKLCFVVLTCFALGSFSYGHSAETVVAEPSLHVTVSEFKSLVNDKQFAAKLGSDEHIMAIYRSHDGGFTILTNKNKVKVDIVAGKVGKGGEQEFHLVFHNPEKRMFKHQFKEKFKERRDRVKEKMDSKQDQTSPNE